METIVWKNSLACMGTGKCLFSHVEGPEWVEEDRRCVTQQDPLSGGRGWKEAVLVH